MPKLLTEEQVRLYQENGFVCPVRALSADEAGSFLARMTDLEAREENLWARSKVKPHLLMTWLNDLMRHPKILDAVEDVLGPDVFAWASGHFDKKPRDPGFVSWHQDGTYWGLSEPSVVTAWVALTPSNRQNGCMRVIPGTHKEGQLPHKDTVDSNNLLSRGQDVEVEVEETEAVDLELQPGEISLHHTMLIHGSSPIIPIRAGSASPSAMSRRMSGKLPASRIAPRWSAAAIPTATSPWSRARPSISTHPRSLSTTRW